VTFFKTAAQFRKWLAKNHASAPELVAGFYKRDSGRGGITYPEALDEALCYGWIDGVRRRVDGESFAIRFTPRRPRSIWSAVNLRHIERLKKDGRLAPPGLAAFAARDPKRSGLYSFENRPRGLAPEYEKRFKANPHAWAYWQSRPPSYQRTACFWVMSAKKEETRERRLGELIASSAQGRPPARWAY
jgi:uncharacterized protein YdeI (YjbR/CyaY-like superfamily)